MTKEEAIKEWQYGKKPQKTKRFFFHYNKPESKKQGRNVMTLHWEDTCIMVNGVETHGADIQSHKQNRQPHCIIRGFATKVSFAQLQDELIAHIYG
jgi:hypothetical protein